MEAWTRVTEECNARIYATLRGSPASFTTVLAAIFYLDQLFPRGIPYSGLQDRDCVDMVVRLFLLGFRLGWAWFEDEYLPLEFWCVVFLLLGL